MKIITILSGEISIDDITNALLQNGIVVLQTLRSRVQVPANQLEEILDIPPGENDERFFIHLSVEVQGEGWSNFFIYSPVAEYIPGETQRLVCNAVLSWKASGSSDKYNFISK